MRYLITDYFSMNILRNDDDDDDDDVYQFPGQKF